MGRKPVILGEEGLASVYYVGPYSGKIKGPCTGYQYPVSVSDREWMYVDVRDVPGIMAMRDADGQLMFRKA